MILDNIQTNSDYNNSPFEEIKRIDEEGNEYWSARELMPFLGYNRWDDFQPVLERAKVSLKNQGGDVALNFQEVSVKSTRGRPSIDILLTRFACYIVVQNGDPRKEEIANGQAYFAINTRYSEELQGLSEMQMIARIALDSDKMQKEQAMMKRAQARQQLELNEVKDSVSNLETNLPINGTQQGIIKGLIHQIADNSYLAYGQVYTRFYKKFEIASYKNLPQGQFQKAKEYLQNELEKYRNQYSLFQTA